MKKIRHVLPSFRVVNYHIFKSTVMDEILGTVTLYAGDFAPHGYEFCNGELMAIDPSGSNPLFSLIGNMYGGDGITSFALPDLKSKVPLPGLNYIICTNGIYPSQW